MQLLNVTRYCMVDGFGYVAPLPAKTLGPLTRSTRLVGHSSVTLLTAQVTGIPWLSWHCVL